MTAEMQQLANDPNFVVQFAVGDPVPDLVPQSRSDGIEMSGAYFGEAKRYVMKKCHLSKDDVRMLDVATGRVVLVSHHPGKNPYESLDPLGLGNTEAQHAVHGGEWESACDVSSRHPSMRGFRIRPKSLSRHGRQYVKTMHGEGDGAIVMNIGKKSKLSTQSVRPHFEVGRGKDGAEEYTVVGDMMERTFTVKNRKGETVAQVAKTTKALIQSAVLGSGSESTVDIAPGVDCSTMLAIVYGLGQVGSHVVKDMANSYIKNPMKDSAVESAVEATGMGGAASAYTSISNSLVGESKKVQKFKQFYKDTFK